MWGYHNDLHPILALVEAGFPVLAYDQSGFGSSMGETGANHRLVPSMTRLDK
jgi:hypothetical protein